MSDRFPDLDSLVTAKLLLPHEAARLQVVPQKVASELHPKGLLLAESGYYRFHI